MSVDSRINQVLSITSAVASVAHLASGLVQAVRDGRATVKDQSGRDLSADELQAAFDAVAASGAAAGDHAEARIDARAEGGQ